MLEQPRQGRWSVDLAESRRQAPALEGNLLLSGPQQTSGSLQNQNHSSKLRGPIETQPIFPVQKNSKYSPIRDAATDVSNIARFAGDVRRSTTILTTITSIQTIEELQRQPEGNEDRKQDVGQNARRRPEHNDEGGIHEQVRN